jgi:hypothetical protein
VPDVLYESMSNLIVVILQVINFLGLVVLGFWTKRWICSLQGTVNAQKETISALKEIINTTDTPEMLKRFESYRKLVDHENQALQDEYKRKLATQKDEMSQSKVEVMKYSQNIINGFIHVFSRLMPYAPMEARSKAIGSSNLEHGFKELLERLAKAAPQISAVQERKASLAAILDDVRLSELFVTEEKK